MSYRSDQIFISPEVSWMLRIVAKTKAVNSGEQMTSDALADCLLRESLTTQYPHLVESWDAHCAVKSQVAKGYETVEKDAVKKIRP